MAKNKRADLSQGRDSGQAGALGRAAPSNHNSDAPPHDRPLSAAEAPPLSPLLDERDGFSAPPLRGKVHPRAEMGNVSPTLDDEARRSPHHPSDGGTTEFAFDPEAADAAADLAGELGSQFLEGATRGEDMSSRVLTEEDRQENDVPFVIEDEFEPVEIESRAAEQDMLAEAGDEEGEPPKEARRRHVSPSHRRAR